MPDTCTRADMLEAVTRMRDHIDGRFDRERDERYTQLEKVDVHLKQLNGKVATHELFTGLAADKFLRIEAELRQARKGDGRRSADDRWSKKMQAGLVGAGVIVVEIARALVLK